jgi:CHAD domain-containing protein
LARPCAGVHALLSPNFGTLAAEIPESGVQERGRMFDTDSISQRPATALLNNVRKNCDQLTDCWKKAHSGFDEGSIHDLRVAGRRLAATLVLIESIRKDGLTKPIRHRLKRLLRTLGPLRDIQVHSTIVNEVHLGADLEDFKSYMEEEENKERKSVRRYLTKKRNRSLRSRIQRLSRKTARGLATTDDAFIKSRVRAVLHSQRARLQEARKSKDPTDPKSLHALRMAAKKLRYSIEAATPVLGLNSARKLQRLRSEQNRLGKVHDLHLARERHTRWKAVTKSQHQGLQEFGVPNRRIS